MLFTTPTVVDDIVHLAYGDWSCQLCLHQRKLSMGANMLRKKSTNFAWRLSHRAIHSIARLRAKRACRRARLFSSSSHISLHGVSLPRICETIDEATRKYAETRHERHRPRKWTRKRGSMIVARRQQKLLKTDFFFLLFCLL